MEEPEFIQRSAQDPQLHAFIQSVADEVRASVDLSNAQKYSVGGADVLLFLVASTLYRWAKDTLDHRRLVQQTEILKQQTEIVASLVKDGLPTKEAQAIVATLLKKITERDPDDAVVSKAFSLLK